MLAQRLITAAIGIPVLLAIILIGGILYTAAVAVILALAVYEFVVMMSAADEESRAAPPAATAATVAGVVLIAFGADSGWDDWTGAIVASLGLVFLASLLAADTARGTRAWTVGAAGLLYVGVLGSYIVHLREFPEGEEWILFAVLATWSTDTFAYFVGKAMGQNKMSPSISPGKTWEGTVGGLLGGLVTIVILQLALGLPMSTGEAVLLGLLLPVVAVAADLGESMLKRGAGVKDTSTLIPGHGGFLDRMDSILFTVPLVYYFAIWVVF